ncbi:MAG: ATP synthase F1 subunit delta [Terriglobales bacterium]
MPGAIAQHYAQALLGVAADGKAEATALRRELAELAALIAGSRELRLALSSPAIMAAQKQAVLGAVAYRLGLSRIMRNFLAVAASRGRAAEVPAIADAFERLWRERQGIRRAEIRSARPLQAAERASIERALAAATGGQIEPEYREDADLIGGFVARVGDTVYDGSLRGRLDRLRRGLLEQ